MYLQALNDGVQGRSYTDNWGGGGGSSYIRVLPDGFLLKSIVLGHVNMNI